MRLSFLLQCATVQFSSPFALGIDIASGPTEKRRVEWTLWDFA